jgi:hypothetical protein
MHTEHRSMQLIRLGGGLVQSETLAKKLAIALVESVTDLKIAHTDDYRIEVDQLPGRWLVKIYVPGGFSIETGESGISIYHAEFDAVNAAVLRWETIIETIHEVGD